MVDARVADPGSAARRVVALLALVAASGIGGGAATDARAFELPALGDLLGFGDPLAVFPDTLPERAAMRLAYEAHDLYFLQEGAKLHDYDLWSTTTLALARAGPVWLGMRQGTHDLDLVQREVHEEDDALSGGFRTEHIAFALAGRSRLGELRLLVGGSRRFEVAGEFRGGFGVLEAVRVRGWVWRSELDLAQTARGTTFFFPFAHRDENGELALALRPFAGVQTRVHVRREVVTGEDLHPEQHNLFHDSRWRLQGSLARLESPRLDVSGGFDRNTLALIMVLDRTRYTQADDLSVDRTWVEAGWRALPSLRLGVGLDCWRLASDDPSYFDIWPFVVWDIFTATRYRLESIRKSWDVTYARLSWTPRPRGGVTFGLDGRFEWWRDDGILLWKKRVPVVPPIIFRFDHRVTSLDWKITHGVQLDTWVEWAFHGNARLRVEGQSVFPFGEEREEAPGEGLTEPTPPPPPPPPATPAPDKSVRGGLTLRFLLASDW